MHSPMRRREPKGCVRGGVPMKTGQVVGIVSSTRHVFLTGRRKRRLDGAPPLLLEIEDENGTGISIYASRCRGDASAR
jgi:hypothetical protein